LLDITLRRQHVRLVLPVLLIFIISSVITVVLLYQAATAQNAAVIVSSERFAGTFLRVRERRLQSVLMDHARWNDDAVENLLIKFSKPWADYNLGGYLNEAHDIAHILVIGGNGDVIYAASNGVPVANFDTRRFGAGFARLLQDARTRSRSEPEPPISPLVVDGTSIQIVAAGLLPPSPVASPDPDAVLVVTRRLDAPALAAIGAEYGLRNMRLYLTDQEMPAPAALGLKDRDGRTVGFLAWDPEFPGSRLLTATLPAVVAANFVIVLLIGFFLIRARRLVMRVETASAQIDAQNAELTKRELHLRAIYDTVTDGLVTIDSEGAILTANPAAGRIFGRQPDELRGVPLADVFEYFPQEILAPEFALRAEEVGASCELIGRRANGTQFSADIAISGVSNTEPQFRVALIRDISERKQIETVLNLLSVDILMVDGEGRLLMANGSGHRRLASGDGLAFDGGVVRARIGDSRRLHNAIRAAADGAPPEGTILNLARSGGRWPLSVLVTSLGMAHSLWNQAPVVLFVSDPERRISVSTEALIDLYDLTPAEARVVSQLAKGKDLQQIAADYGLSISTLRNQLRQAFRKTGTSRQPELISLVLSNASLIAGSQASTDFSNHAAVE
jgi:PAS domain S-box-containing protein